MGDLKYRTHLDNLKEMILDEEKLVTYITVSKDFCIHINNSKSLLYEVVEDIKQKQPKTPLNINYIISGLTGDNKANTTVCSQDDLISLRKNYRNILFEHIYSVNKGKPSIDKVAFMATTTFDDYLLCPGLIKSSLSLKRTTEEIDKLKLNSLVSVVADIKPNKPLQKKVKEEKQENVKDDKVNGHGDTKQAKEIKIEPKSSETSPTEKDSSLKIKPEPKSATKSQKGIAGFFSRSDSASSKKINKDVKKVEQNIKEKEKGKEDKNKDNDIKEIEVENMDVDDEPPAIKKEIKNEISQTGKDKKNDEHSKTKNKSLTQIKKNAKVDKKRKRVLHVSDSESEDEKNDPFKDEPDEININEQIESEDEIPATPLANTVKITTGITNPRKRRKIVDKTYTDEEGYILTKKEEVYESLSEDETSNAKENIEISKVKNEVSPKEKSEKVNEKSDVSPKDKKNGPKIGKKKISPPQKGKQATLMSFFKKV